MVLPTTEQYLPKSLEDRLARKFDELQISRENHMPELFDELAKSLEVLMKAVPDAYEELMTEKQKLDKELEKEEQDTMLQAQMSRDEISKEFIISKRMTDAMWEYREIYEEIIIEILQKYDLISIRKFSSSMMSDYDSEVQMQPYEQPQQQQYQNPPTQKKGKNVELPDDLEV